MGTFLELVKTYLETAAPASLLRLDLMLVLATSLLVPVFALIAICLRDRRRRDRATASTMPL